MSLSHGREKRSPAGGGRSLWDCNERELASGAVDGGRAPATGVLAGGRAVAAGSRLSRLGPGNTVDVQAEVVAAGWCMGSGHPGRAARVREGDVLLGARGRRGRAVTSWGGQRRKGRTHTGFHRLPMARECGGTGCRRGGAGAAAGRTNGGSRSERVCE
jgi:hypothetical protein